MSISAATSRAEIGSADPVRAVSVVSTGSVDLPYGAELLDRRRIPGVGDRSLLAATTDKVLALEQRIPGLIILPAHDPTAAHRLLHGAQ